MTKKTNQILDNNQLITQDDFEKFKKRGLIEEIIVFSEIENKIYKKDNTFLFKDLQYITKDYEEYFILNFEAFISSNSKFDILFDSCVFSTSATITNKNIKQKILFNNYRCDRFDFDKCTFENEVQFLGSGGSFNKCTFKDDLGLVARI